MSDPQHEATPPTATGTGAEADARPDVPARASSSFASPLSTRHLGATWQIVAAMAVLVGLLTGLVTLIDRFGAAPTPAPVVTPAPTTPGLRVDVSSSAGAAELVAFAERHTGNLVALDLSCYETVRAPACIFESSGLEVDDSGLEWLWLWLFTGTPCFQPPGDEATDARVFATCQGTSLLWIDPRIEGSAVVLGNIQGAGTTAIKGTWELASPAGGAIFPGNIHGFRLTPHLTRPPAAGGASSPAGG